MTRGKTYEVIGIEGDCYRIVNDSSDPCLYEPSDFEVVDPSEPTFWVSEVGADGERYAYPIAWSSAGFFEDFHDQMPQVVTQFWSEQQYTIAFDINVSLTECIWGKNERYSTD